MTLVATADIQTVGFKSLKGVSAVLSLFINFQEANSWKYLLCFSSLLADYYLLRRLNLKYKNTVLCFIEKGTLTVLNLYTDIPIDRIDR